RIRDRRIAVRRDEGRRRLRLLLAVLTLSAAILLGWAATRSPLLNVDHVRLVGAQHTDLEQVLAATGLRRGAAMIDLDESHLAAKVAGLPWVAAARVHRSWPGSVTIAVTERAPVAAVPAAAGGWALVDDTGRVLAVDPVP